ncbi:glycosyltransferase family 2 protein [Paracoccus litorisediminis]|uniref:Glycosyl transferase family 2 n=1 Tax=Paracoccus litorisediminis TaxID=2006130 RepID=A0A844HRL6_9RHOB|nr:glycosyltransferase family 2 protein [Paracoccus litorisediminis]MTH60977.1 hypothetical protein [Paracoccus litorisediminis]
MSFEPICFVTMVRGDHAMLEKWIAHHSKLVANRSALHVFLHGHDPALQKIAEGCSLVTLPFDPSGSSFEESRRQLFFGLAGALRGYYGHVITLDCDEFMTMDPGVGQTLAEYLSTHPFEGAALSPVGFDVVQRSSAEQDPVDFARPILGQRCFGFLDGTYSKPCIFRRQPRGGSQHSLAREKWEIDPKIFLFHFRFFDVEYSRQVNAARMALVADFDKQGSDHAIGTWGDREERFARALQSADVADCPDLSPELIEAFRASQLENYQNRGGRFMWRDCRRGPYRLPAQFEGVL